MIIHSIGLFHTEGTDDHSHCAYTQKTRRLVPMLAVQGYKVIHYHAGKFEPIYGPFNKAECDENIELVQLITSEKLRELRELAIEELKTSNVFEGDLANVGTSLFAIFHGRLMDVIKEFVSGNDDIFLHHFGWPHKELGNLYPKAIHIEPGIGYPDTFAPYRMFESKAWLDHVTGKKQQMPQYGDFIVPNHFDETYWTYDPSVKKEAVVYMGRIYDQKGCQIFGMLSDYFDVPFIMAGQGDKDYIDRLLAKHKNLSYVGVLKGRERVDFLQKAKAMILPTQYFEPFGGAIIEGAMCGAIPITSDFGVFPETIPGLGITCRTLKDYIDAVSYALQVEESEHHYVSTKSTVRFGMTIISHKYDYLLQKIVDMHKYDWIEFDLDNGYEKIQW
jgi:glycosyltransferase involved in cell wall biosynthesis